MEPERWRPSTTVAAIAQRGGRFLLVEEHTREGLRLNNPAGHLEAGESLVDAVVRETLEETGCLLRPDGLVGVYLARMVRPATQEDVTYLRFAFCGTLEGPDPGHVPEPGIVAVHWLTIEEVRQSAARHRSPLVLQCIEDHAAGQRHPLSLLHRSASLDRPWTMG
jgi:8-oxo-dGTP pyrophosphatase MutT (NUDIX family)